MESENTPLIELLSKPSNSRKIQGNSVRPGPFLGSKRGDEGWLAFDGRRCGTPSCLRQVASLAYVATTCRVYGTCQCPETAGGIGRWEGDLFCWLVGQKWTGQTSTPTKTPDEIQHGV